MARYREWVSLVTQGQFFPPPENDPPPWIVSRPPPPGEPPRHPGPGRPVLLVAAAVVVLVVAAAAGWWLLRPGATGQTPEAATPPVVATADPPDGEGSGQYVPPAEEPTFTPEPEPTPENTPESTADPEAEALDRLEAISRDDLTAVSLDGRYVAQLASKNPGTHDPIQTTASGSHTFGAADILAEHERLRSDPANGSARVVLLKSTDYGKRQLHNGAPLYVTFALGDFGTEADVRSWCAERFPRLSTEELANQCAVRRLRPPA